MLRKSRGPTLLEVLIIFPGIPLAMAVPFFLIMFLIKHV